MVIVRLFAGLEKQSLTRRMPAIEPQGVATVFCVDKNFLQEYPLSKEHLSLFRVWRSSLIDHGIIAAKGAPETIFDLCLFQSIPAVPSWRPSVLWTRH